MRNKYFRKQRQRVCLSEFHYIYRSAHAGLLMQAWKRLMLGSTPRNARKFQGDLSCSCQISTDSCDAVAIPV